jgi:hypothetical protein
MCSCPPQVAETCQLAVRRLEWLQQHPGEPVTSGPYLSVDPAPAAEERDVGRLREVLLDEAQPLFDRYRAMFALRNAGGEEAALALAEGEQGARVRVEVSVPLLVSGMAAVTVQQCTAGLCGTNAGATIQVSLVPKAPSQSPRGREGPRDRGPAFHPHPCPPFSPVRAAIAGSA